MDTNSYITPAERKIENDLEKMFGDKHPELKSFVRLSMLKEHYKDDPDFDNTVTRTMNKMRLAQVRERQNIEEVMVMTLDASGNVVPLP